MQELHLSRELGALDALFAHGEHVGLDQDAVGDAAGVDLSGSEAIPDPDEPTSGDCVSTSENDVSTPENRT